MSAELIKALTAAGAVDTDLWKLARTDLTSAVAVADLQERYPGAFRAVEPPFDIRAAPKAEVERRWRELQAKDYQRLNDARQQHTMDKLAQQFGTKK